MNYPTSWPADCPPADAEIAQGTVFRVCRSNPPTENDFMSHAELGKSSVGSACQRSGLSVFRPYNDACHLTQIFPRLGSLIFQADLQAPHGKTKPTSSKQNPSHTTWWPCEGINRAEPFQMVAGAQEH